MLCSVQIPNGGRVTEVYSPQSKRKSLFGLAKVCCTLSQSISCVFNTHSLKRI